MYELLDPRDGSVFYVGKGCGDRIDDHEKEAASGVSSKKCNKIRKIVGSGLTIGKRKVAHFREEQDAYDFEAERIKFYGKPSLTNVAPLPAGEEPATHSAYLSAAFMRLMAIGYLAEAGLPNDYTNRPWAAACQSAFMRRFKEFRDLALKEVGFDALRDGVRPFGVTLVRGG